MNAFSIPGAPAWFNLLLNLSFQAAVLAAIVWIVIKVFGRWMPPNWRALMWSLVILRSLIPFAPPSHFSVQNLFSKPNHLAAVKITVERPSPTIQFVQPTGSNVLYNPLSHTLPFEQPKAETLLQPSVQPLALAWGLGAIFFGGLLVARTWIIRRALVRTGVEPASAILNILASCREAFGARYPLRVTASDQIASPALTGFIPARLIIPTTFTTDRYTPSQIRHILLHELAHIQQGHLILHWLALIGRVVHWFNPAIHFAAAQMRQECELAADNAALKNSTAEERAAYGETILQVLSHSTAPPTLLALGMAEHARHLKQRLSALANPHQRHFRSLGLAFLAVLIVTGLTSAIENQDPTPATITEAEFVKMRGQTTARYSIRNKNAISSDHLEDLQNERAQAVKTLVKSVEETSHQTVQNKNALSSEVVDARRSEGARASKTIAEAKALIEAGHYQEAEKLILQALDAEPDNRVARYYLDLIAENSRTVIGDYRPGPAAIEAANEKMGIPSRKSIQRKLETIRIDNFPVKKETDLVDVLKDLGTEVRKRDPKKRGVNFIISIGRDITSNSPAIDVEQFKIKIEPEVRDLTLGQLLNAIVKVARPPKDAPPSSKLEYRVEEYAVVFSASQDEPVAFYTRTYRLNPNIFSQGIEGVNYSSNPLQFLGNKPLVTTNTNPSALQNNVRAFFTAAGVDFSTNSVGVGDAVPAAFGVAVPGTPQQKAIFFNDRTGVLFVRATLKDLDLIESAVHTLNIQKAASASPTKPAEDLITRSYKLDREQFKKQLEGVRPRIVGTQIHDISVQVHAFADLVGVDFSTNTPWSWPNERSRKAIFYNDSTGHLFARATAQELDRLERAIANPNLVPPQVSISMRAYEIPGEKVAWIKTNFVTDRVITATNEFVIASTNATNARTPLLEQTKQIVASIKKAEIATNIAAANQYIIQGSAFKSFLKQFENAKGVDGLVAPNVTTLIGRQARISIEETLTIVTPNGTNYAEVHIPFGWAFDCFPESFDGADLQITTGAAQTKFHGYENQATSPAPRFHVEATGSRAKLPTGSSLAFLMAVPNRKDLPVLGDLPFIGRLFRSEQEPRHILILITPTIVDATGNAVFPQAD
ncbi:MAG TPA: M56 family metallopeptidase [Verrucomicrobiae bacterium]|nr:M56 family metallopeptidase [Verrucomicrobiae bacterium]